MRFSSFCSADDGNHALSKTLVSNRYARIGYCCRIEHRDSDGFVITLQWSQMAALRQKNSSSNNKGVFVYSTLFISLIIAIVSSDVSLLAV